jgi:putative peptidoglycan lipid II flippase
VRKAFKLLVPRVLALSMNQLTLLVNTFIASFLMTGSITIYYLADNLQALPLGIIAISFAITSFATLSELAIESDKSLFAKEITRVMHQVLYLVIPATLGILLLRKEIIDVILVSGKFSASDALITQNVLSVMLFSLFAQSLIPILSRGFYAYHDTKTPLKAGIIATILSIGGSLILAFYYKLGIMGITAAYSAGGVLFFVLLYVLMKRKIQQDLLDWMNIMKMIAASIVMIMVVNLLRMYIPYDVNMIQKITILVILALTGMIVYLALSFMFDIPERRMILRK